MPNYEIHAVLTDISAELKVLDDQEILTANSCVNLPWLVTSAHIRRFTRVAFGNDSLRTVLTLWPETHPPVDVSHGRGPRFGDVSVDCGPGVPEFLGSVLGAADGFKLSNDPQFVEEAYEVIGPYPNPPEATMVYMGGREVPGSGIGLVSAGISDHPGTREKPIHRPNARPKDATAELAHLSIRVIGQGRSIIILSLGLRIAAGAQSTLIRQFRPDEVNPDDPKGPPYTRTITNSRFRNSLKHRDFCRETPNLLACGEDGSAPARHAGGRIPLDPRQAPAIIAIAGAFPCVNAGGEKNYAGCRRNAQKHFLASVG